MAGMAAPCDGKRVWRRKAPMTWRPRSRRSVSALALLLDRMSERGLKDVKVKLSWSNAWSALETVRHVEFRVHGRGSDQSGRADSNRRPLDPQSSALTKLRYAPLAASCSIPAGRSIFCPSRAAASGKPADCSGTGRALRRLERWPKPQAGAAYLGSPPVA